MDEEEHTDRKLQFAMLCQKLAKIKRNINDDDTDNINKIISSNSPSSCLAYLTNLEKKGDPNTDNVLLNKLMDCYTQVFSNMPVRKYCQMESYARMLVRFAELKAIQDISDARDNFCIAVSHCEDFAFVHIAFAEFERKQGHAKKAASILQRACELDAKPTDHLQAAIQNLKSGRSPIISQEDKENIAYVGNGQEFSKVESDSSKDMSKMNGKWESPLSELISSGMNQKSGSVEDQVPFWRPSAQRKQRSNYLPGRVPVFPLSIPEDGSDDIGNSSKSDVPLASGNLSRQTSGSRVNTMLSFSQSKKNSHDGDFNLKSGAVSPEPRPWQDISCVETTTTLLHCRQSRQAAMVEDTTDHVNEVISSNSPESCWAYLAALERNGDPRSNPAFLSRLLDCYAMVFAKLPPGKHSKNESFARMLVRFAELKGFKDPDEARDDFFTARSNSRGFAFVHIAHAQFEISQGNARQSTSILQKALGLKASPVELLEMALQNLKAGKTLLLSTPDKPAAIEPAAFSLQPIQQDEPDREAGPLLYKASTLSQQKPSMRDSRSDLRVPTRINKHVSPEDKKMPNEPLRTPRLVDRATASAAQLPARVPAAAMSCQTPICKDIPSNSFVTPVMKQRPTLAPPTGLGTNTKQNPLPETPQNQGISVQQTPQGTALSNESITIKGQQFFILKMIGRGGSSKVYQVLDHRKQLYAIKFVNLEEADTQTVESYKNEIEHLNHLQQYSDQIIKLYDYEITDSYIYMLMECGDLDLNTWLRKRKSVDALERKLYWRNMLEAVQTIHKHGIIHSDLKPANFVFVNASLKLIDFGIANRIQPDVTSIMKDSQVGTLNYMPPEAIRDTSSKAGKQGTSKISPKGDVWSLGCILYCMTYGKTPFQSITNQFTKLHAIIDPKHEIEFPDISEKDLLDVLKLCLVRNPKERISISQLLEHPYLQLQPQKSPEQEVPNNDDLRRILNELAALQSPNSIARAATNLAKMCNTGKRLDVAECVRKPRQPL